MECKHYLIRLFIDFCGKRVGEIEMGWEQKALSWVNLIMMMMIIIVIIIIITILIIIMIIITILIIIMIIMIIIIIIVMRFKSGHSTR